MKPVVLLGRLCVACLLLAVAAAWLPAPAADDAKPAIAVDKEKKVVTVDCKVAPRKIDDPAYKEIYPIEVIASWPFSKEAGKGGQKAHETVVVFDNSIKPSMIHKALEEIGLKAGAPVMGGGAKDVPQGPEVQILLEFPTADGTTKKIPIEKTLIDPKTKKAMPKLQWRFTGSAMVQPDPNNPAKVYGADTSGTLISIFPVTNNTVFQTNLTMAEEKFIKLDTDRELLPKEGTAVKLIIQVPQK